MTSNAVVQKLWNYCNILRDDGLSYQDYIEQLTFLLFLKMADERQKLFPDRAVLIPRALDWQSLERLDGDDLDQHYRHILVELGKKPGMLGTIFRKAQNRIQDPAKLKRLISDLIGRETWTTLGVDVKGDAYEGLLEKNAADVKGGAGQYFTPRALIQAIVDVMRPEPGQLIHDPACGTGGFLLAVHDYISHNFTLDKDDKRFLMEKALSGVEIVDGTARLCAMNLFLHGAEAFKEFYSGGQDVLYTRYWYLGLNGHHTLVPYAWSAVGLNLLAFALFIVPAARRNWVILNIGCIATYAGVYIEKGMGLIIPGLTPDALGEIYEYYPSVTELRVAAGIFAVGFLVFTLMLKVAVPISLGEFTEKKETSDLASVAWAGH